MIRPNQKLTGVLKGRVLESFEAAADGFVLRFADRSTMHIKTTAPVAESTISEFYTAAVVHVRQHDTNLALEFDSRESSLLLQTSEPTASVLIRDANGSLEYAD